MSNKKGKPSAYCSHKTLTAITETMGYKRRIKPIYVADRDAFRGNEYPDDITIGNELCRVYFFPPTHISITKSEITEEMEFDVEEVANSYTNFLMEENIHPSDDESYWENLCIFCQSTPTHFNIWLGYYLS